MGKYSCPCLRPTTTGKRVRLPMPPGSEVSLKGRKNSLKLRHFVGLHVQQGRADGAATEVHQVHDRFHRADFVAAAFGAEGVEGEDASGHHFVERVAVV